MGGEPGEGGLTSSRLFLFDENLTPVGRALAQVYREEVRVVATVTELGRGADDDRHIIPWCFANNAVWVTKD